MNVSAMIDIRFQRLKYKKVRADQFSQIFHIFDILDYRKPVTALSEQRAAAVKRVEADSGLDLAYSGIRG